MLQVPVKTRIEQMSLVRKKLQFFLHWQKYVGVFTQMLMQPAGAAFLRTDDQESWFAHPTIDQWYQLNPLRKNQPSNVASGRIQVRGFHLKR